MPSCAIVGTCSQTELPVVVDDDPHGWLTRGCPRFAVVAASTFLRAPSSGDAMSSLPLLLASCLATLVSAGGGADLHPAPAPLGLWWHAPVLSGGGYGSEANALLVGLAGLGADAPPLRATHHGDSLDPDFVRGLPPTTRDVLDALLRSRRPAPADAIVVCHSEPGAWAPALYQTSPCPPRGYAPNDHAYVVGRTMFETDRLDPAHVERANAMREVWVPTAWGADVFARSGVRREKIRVVPEAVDVAAFQPSEPPRSNAFEHFENVASNGDAFGRPFDLVASSRRLIGPPPSSRRAGARRADGSRGGSFATSFLSVFKWEPRKAPEILLGAYLAEFTADDDVALFLRCDTYHDARGQDAITERVLAIAREAWRGGRRWGFSRDGDGDGDGDDGKEDDSDFGVAAASRAPRVFQVPRVGDVALPAMYRAADVFVLPSRGEGWGRPHVEAMASALPVIATDWSGPAEFLTRENGYPLAIEPELAHPPEGHHFASHRWAQPNATRLRELMRETHERPEEARAKGRVAREDVERRFAPDVVARLVAAHVERIEAETRSERARREDL